MDDEQNKGSQLKVFEYLSNRWRAYNGNDDYSSGVVACMLVAKHFNNSKDHERADYLLHELGHLIYLPVVGSPYFVRTALAMKTDFEIEKLVSNVVDLLSEDRALRNEVDAIRFGARFWLTLDPKFPVEKYVRDCAYAGDHAGKFSEALIMETIGLIVMRDRSQDARVLFLWELIQEVEKKSK